MTGERPVWGYFALAILCSVTGAILLLLGLGERLPDEEALEKISGEVGTVVLIDSLSDQPATLSTPLNEIHFTLRGRETTFRYPSGWPGYSSLYERLAFEVDVWVDAEELGGEQPVTIYRLEQRPPEGFDKAPISVSYQDIVETQDTSYQSYLQAGPILLLLGLVLLAAGVLMIRWNRRHRLVPKAD